MLDFSFEPYRQEMIETLKDFIKIESVKSAGQPNMPYGKGIFDALMFVQSTAERMDLDCVNMFGHLAYVDYGEGDEMLAILTHLDVVPKGEEWTMPAFEGIEKDGRIYGRGAIDNKGPAIAALYALKALSDNCAQLDKKVRLIFGGDEETTWEDMDFYKKHEVWPNMAFSPDGEYPIINSEKGLMHVQIQLEAEPVTEGVCVTSFNAGTRVNVVPNKADCFIKAPLAVIQKSLTTYTCPTGAQLSCEDAGDGLVHIMAAGKSAHGSRPEHGVNAAASLLQYLGTLPLCGGPLSEGLYDLVKNIGVYYNGEPLGLDVTDESGRLTFNLGTVSLAGNTLKAGLDIRYPMSMKAEQIKEKLRTSFSRFQFTYPHELDAHFVPEDSELVVKLKEAYQEITGDEAYCMSIGGATYARAFENAVTFGPLFPGQPQVEHGPDEYIEIETLIKNAQIIANAVIKLCGE